MVRVGEVIGDLPGPFQALHQNRTPQRGFTLADQVHQLVSASEADPDRGFMARMMVLCSLPRSNPGNRLQYKRVNGPFTLYMTASGGNKLPFGNLPRLLLAWLCTEAVRTQSRVLVLAWQQVYRQFGVEPDRASDKVTVQAFRRKVLRELKKGSPHETEKIVR